MRERGNNSPWRLQFHIKNWRKEIIRLTQCCQQPKQKGENYFSNYFNIFQRCNRECSICCQKSVSICISAGKDSTSNQLKSSGFVEPELLKILSKYKITRSKQKKRKEKERKNSRKLKTCSLLTSKIRFQVITIKERRYNMGFQRWSQNVTDCSVFLKNLCSSLWYTPHVLFSFVLASIIFEQSSSAWRFLGYTSSNAGQFTASTIAYYFWEYVHQTEKKKVKTRNRT